MKRSSAILSIGLFLLSACSPAGTAAATPATVPPRPTATATQAVPTPASTGDTIVWRELKVSMNGAEITEHFTTEFGTQRLPTAGRKFLWVNVRLENTGTGEIRTPAYKNFSVLYAESEIKPIYGHRQGHKDYTTLGSVIFPEQELDGWLRFDIPGTAELGDLRFVFLPTTYQVGVPPSSPNYPYREGILTYVWELGR